MVATPTDKYTLMQGPNGEALVYIPGVGTKPIPDPANPGAPLRYQQAQVQWYDLLPQLDTLLQQADTSGMQPGVIPSGYNQPTASQGTAPPSGPPKTSADGRYREVDTPDGRMIQDNVSGVRYSANMAPQDVLNSLYAEGAPASTRPADAATPVGQQAPPIQGGVVKENVYGNPTAGERAGGITTTSYPLPPTPGGYVPPTPTPTPTPTVAPPVNMAQAPTDRANLPILKLPNSVDYGGSASSIFGTYMGNYAPAQQTQQPQAGGTQFRPLSVGAAPSPAPTAASASPAVRPPQVSMGTVPNSNSGLNPNDPNAIRQAKVASRVWGYIGDTHGGAEGEVQPGNWGWYDPSQLTTPPPGAPPNPYPDRVGQTFSQYSAATEAARPQNQAYNPNAPRANALPSNARDFLGSAYTPEQKAALQISGVGTPLPGGYTNPTVGQGQAQYQTPSVQGGTRFNVLSSGTVGDVGVGASPPPPPPPLPPKEGDPGPPRTLANGQTQATHYVYNPITGELVLTENGPPVWPSQPVQPPVNNPGYNPVPKIDPASGRQIGWDYQPARDYIPPTATGADTPLQAAQIAQIMTGLHLTQAQTEQIMQMLPINVQQGQANIAAVYAGIQNAAAQLGLQINQQQFNQAATEAGLTGQYTNQAGNTVPTLTREQTFGFDAQGNPTLAARGFQHQLEQDYHANELADIASQRSDAGLTGYYQGQQTTQFQQQNADAERANLLAQASIGNTAAQIKLAELQQQEGARQFDANNALARQEADRQWRQNPSSFLDQAWASRGGTAPTQGGYAAPQPQMKAAQAQVPGQEMQGQVMKSGAIVAPGTQGQSPPGYTPATQQGPLTYNDIRASGVEPPGLAAATGGYAIPQYRTAGGMPMVSQQALGQLTSTERQAFGAELQATGNNPEDYYQQQRFLTQNPVRSTGGYSQPRPAY